jgi:hypothetical protein
MSGSSPDMLTISLLAKNQLCHYPLFFKYPEAIRVNHQWEKLPPSRQGIKSEKSFVSKKTKKFPMGHRPGNLLNMLMKFIIKIGQLNFSATSHLVEISMI